MLAKNKRPPAKPDIHAQGAANVQATRLAYEWVTRSIALRATGNASQAKAAEQKARHWLNKAKVLEAKVADTPRIGAPRIARRSVTPDAH
jgi:hypothetical protein